MIKDDIQFQKSNIIPRGLPMCIKKLIFNRGKTGKEKMLIQKNDNDPINSFKKNQTIIKNGV